jgi:TolB-like protein/Flp pilus assembly protein TadD
MSATGKAVFLSYASQDGDSAARICAALRGAGIEVWFDQSELRGGDAWDRQIRKQIHDCALFIALVSGHSNERTEGYFRREWRLAVDRTHDMSDRVPFLVPVVIDQTRESNADVPEPFLRVQWTRLPDGNATTAFVERIQRLLTPGQPLPTAIAPPLITAGQDAASAPPRPSRTAESVWWRRSVPLIVAIAGLIVGVIAIGRFMGRPQAPSSLQQPGSAPRPALASPSAVSDKSVAVLPFIDMSEKKDQEYFADGLAEALSNLLAKIPELRVAARTSSFYFKGKQATVAEVGKALNVGHVVEGSVQKSGNAIRITVQLVQVKDGFELWSETYDRQLSEIFKIQDEIATSIIKALKLHLLTGELPPSGSAEHARAYSMLLQCQFLARTAGDQNQVQQARDCLARVAETDPTYALAWTRLSTYLSSADPRRCQAAQRAMSLDPSLPDAHVAQGYCMQDHWDWTGAEREFRGALALDKNNNSALRAQAHLLLLLGRFDEAILLYHRVLERDPVSVGACVELAWTLWLAGKANDALQTAQSALDLSPNQVQALAIRSLALLDQGSFAAALATAQQVRDDGDRQWGLAIVYNAMGRKSDADHALAELLKHQSTTSPMVIAMVYAYRNERDAAFDWIERAYRQNDDVLAWIKNQRLLANIRSDPRYQQWLTKLNFPQ